MKSFFERYCASCHGTAMEEGSVSTARAAEAPDLTRLTDRLGRALPRGALASFLDARRELCAHGKREMPVCGMRPCGGHPQTPGAEALREGTVALIVDCFQTIQVA